MHPEFGVRGGVDRNTEHPKHGHAEKAIQPAEGRRPSFWHTVNTSEKFVELQPTLADLLWIECVLFFFPIRLKRTLHG